ncbi:hypothetical protein AGABI1DRAFT_133549 [Agaricus bisporus var. burnettii JB137-S8]|uniref:C2H2-type domain-containing protein n=2 Tax=Agaricus bisporus var. burnettii (strain JB137-S8 / ATCC MYA-4627 / FGSC 10392) TaxID=597362 RepID=K5VIM2_AGABU|nr:uncharacterized protein AGABI1DRAFT_133549 [Agaricus bisporus var. burnettii JB137-S8]EKM74174.1 hypothetical protein AGABI1DRAFT_133549 [Agaricus bisporus var. burnettii JB137-S8]
MKRGADDDGGKSQRAVANDKRPKTQQDREVQKTMCLICGGEVTQLGKQVHGGCVLEKGFFALQREAFSLHRDPDDKKVGCPKCEYKNYNMDQVKKHLRVCTNTRQPATPPTAPSMPQLPTPAANVTQRDGEGVVQHPPSLTDDNYEVSIETTLHSHPDIKLLLQEILHESAHDEGGRSESSKTRVKTTVCKDGSFQSHLLREHDLVINTTHRILICIPCKGIINPFDIRGHLQHHHKAFKSRLTLQQEFDEEVLDEYFDLTDNPPHPALAVDPIYGLADPIPGHIQCGTCHHCYASRKTFNLHQCPKPDPLPTPTHVQQFRNFSGSPWFAVIPRAVPHPQQTPWQLYQNTASHDDPNEGSANHENYRILHQFFHKEGWIEKLQRRQHERLMPLVSCSTSDPTYGTLHKHIVTFLAEAQQSSQAYYLRRLISSRPAEEHDETKVRHHRPVNPSTLQNYAHVVATLIAFIHRIVISNQTEYQFKIPIEITSSCKQLISSLNVLVSGEDLEVLDLQDVEAFDTYDSDDDSDIDNEEDMNISTVNQATTNAQKSKRINSNIINLLYALYTQIPSSQNRGNFFSPINHYVLLSSL